MSEKDLDFDGLEPNAVPVKYLGKVYCLREASEGAAAQWRNAGMRAARFGPDGRVQSVDGAADVQALLVSLCLFQVTEGGNPGNPVPLSVIRSWPARVVKPIYERAREISRLTEEPETVEDLERQITKLQDRLEKLRTGETLEKNSPGGTTGTSG